MNSKIEIDSGEVWFKMMGALLHAALESEPRQQGSKHGRPTRYYGITIKADLPG
jgi:hypothetical protein